MSNEEIKQILADHLEFLAQTKTDTPQSLNDLCLVTSSMIDVANLLIHLNRET